MTMPKNLPGKLLKPTVGTGAPRTPEQLAAGQRNFATFTLKGWRSNLNFIQGQVSVEHFQALSSAIENCLHELKGEPCDLPKASETVLDEWTLIGTPGNHRLCGKVYGHRRGDLQDSDIVTTSKVLAYNSVTKVATTATGTTYHLGKPNSCFAGDAFDNIAKAQLAVWHSPLKGE